MVTTPLWHLSDLELARAVAAGRMPVVPLVVPGPLPALRSVGVPMVDGVVLAVDLWIPADQPPAGWPCILILTRYWRSAGFAGWEPAIDDNAGLARLWAARGFALAVGDVRGTGASGGGRLSEWAPAEVADYAALIDWLAAQPWSSGQVVTEGGSYAGNASELAALLGRPAHAGAICRYTDYRPYSSIAFPGGVPNRFILRGWAAMTAALDRHDSAIVAAFAGLEPGTVLAPRPVEGDADGTALHRALADHAGNHNIGADAAGILCADDVLNPDLGLGLDDLGPAGRQPGTGSVPQFAWASWMDAGTADGLLRRFVAQPDTAIDAVIGAWSHGTRWPADPFHLAPVPPLPALVDDYADFAQARCRREGPPRRQIRYYTLGADRWTTTTHWPPAGQNYQPLFLGTDGLSPDVPAAGSIRHDLSSQVSSGRRNRWWTQIGGGPVAYDDLRPGRLTYSSAPLDRDREITGHPVLHLTLSADAPDLFLLAYLGAVDPDGRFIYLTDGQLRACHRASADPNRDGPFGPPRRFHRADLMPPVPGQPIRLDFALLPVSALVPAGYRLVLCLAGADADTFGGPPDPAASHLILHHGGDNPSRLSLPFIEAT